MKEASKAPTYVSPEYRDNFDRIWRKKKKESKIMNKIVYILIAMCAICCTLSTCTLESQESQISDLKASLKRLKNGNYACMKTLEKEEG